jgi:hypothetical protein
MSTRPLQVDYLRHGAVYKRGYYARTDTALPTAIKHLIIDGQPGDVASLHLREYGTLVLEVKVTVGGRIKLTYAKD